MKHSDWIYDSFTPSVRLAYEVNGKLIRERTKYQELVLLENERLGQVMLLDGATQVTTADEFMYHEMLAHVPIFAHGAVEDVLIVGGGDCGLAREVLKHRDVQRVVQVEIDARVVEVARRHLSTINGGVFEDDRYRLSIGDGATFMDGLDERFDLVLIDSTDPEGSAAKLFTSNFYRTVRRCLRPGGAMVTQAGGPFIQEREFAATLSNLARVFDVATCYLLACPSYPGGHFALGWGSESLVPTQIPIDVLKVRHVSAALKLRYYTPDVHLAAFALPGYIEAITKGAIDEGRLAVTNQSSDSSPAANTR